MPSTKLMPMLAKPFREDYLKPPVLAQPKLDGVRLLWDGETSWSRTGRPIEGVPSVLADLSQRFSGFPLDGELYCHGMHFQEIVGLVKRKKNVVDDPRIQYHVYDHPVPGLAFNERWARLAGCVENAGSVKVVLVPTTVYDPEDPNPYALQGYEGTMLRNSGGSYKFAHRSSDLLKVKMMQDDEFEVIGISERMSYDKVPCQEGTPGSHRHTDGTWYTNENPKPTGTVGALTCIAKNGSQFDVGSGMDDAERKIFWEDPPIGKLVTVKYQELSLSGHPRFPVYKAVRDYE